MAEILIALIVLSVITIGIPIIIYRWLAKKGYKNIGLTVGLLIIGIPSFFIYTAVYPLDSFYQEDFERYTGLTFPPSGKIVAKDATYPDQHGKYDSEALVEFSETDYNSLLLKTTADRTFKLDTTLTRSAWYYKVAKRMQSKSIIKIVQKGEISITFLNDKKTVMIEGKIR